MDTDKAGRELFREANKAIDAAFKRKAVHLKVKRGGNRNRDNKLNYILSEERRTLNSEEDQW